MKYVYAILTILEGKPIMQTLISEKRLTGRMIMDKVILNDSERKKYESWNNEEEILNDISKTTTIEVEIQEVEVG